MNNQNNTYSELYGYKVDNNAIASPGAQTFTAPHDAFLSSVNLYFTEGKYSPDEPDLGITMEIRNVINGVPGNEYYGRTTLSNKQISSTVDTSGNTPTKFTFDNPVFLQGGKQYAIVLYTPSINYQLAVSVIGEYTQGSNSNVTTEGINANQEVHGTFCYSMDGKTWNTGDPTSHLSNAANGTLCLKFDVNTVQFDNTDNDDIAEFSAKNLGNLHYSARNKDQTMDNMSYFTFLPSVFTPNNTSVNWYYALGADDIADAVPLNKNSTVQLPDNDGLDQIHIWAKFHGSENVSPVINTGSMNLTVQTTEVDADNVKRPDTSPGLYLTPDQNGNPEHAANVFSREDDTVNAGEYISRNIDFKRQDESQDPYFNQVFASYEFQANGSPRPSIYFNLNANDDDQNNFKPVWIQMPGYDEFLHNSHYTNGHYYTVDPYNSTTVIDGISGELPGEDENEEVQEDIPERTYSQNITDNPDDPDSNWVRYHFHTSLNRLYQAYQQHECKAAYSAGQHVISFTNYNPFTQQANSDNAYEIEFKLVFHAHSIYKHPKLRNFRTTMNDSNLTNLSDIQPS